MQFVESEAYDMSTACERHVVISENTTQITYDGLFAAYLHGASAIEVVDPYIVTAQQMRNFTEFLATIGKVHGCLTDRMVCVNLTTRRNRDKADAQLQGFKVMQDSAKKVGILFQWTLTDSSQCHARSIRTDSGWKILLDRGLDIFERYAFFNAYDLSNTLQESRVCRRTEITYLRETQNLVA